MIARTVTDGSVNVTSIRRATGAASPSMQPVRAHVFTAEYCARRFIETRTTEVLRHFVLGGFDRRVTAEEEQRRELRHSPSPADRMPSPPSGGVQPGAIHDTPVLPAASALASAARRSHHHPEGHMGVPEGRRPAPSVHRNRYASPPTRPRREKNNENSPLPGGISAETFEGQIVSGSTTRSKGVEVATSTGFSGSFTPLRSSPRLGTMKLTLVLLTLGLTPGLHTAGLLDTCLRTSLTAPRKALHDLSRRAIKRAPRPDPSR